MTTMTQVSGLQHPNFTGISPSEFFYRNRHMAGFGNPVQAVYSTVRELVENSLDACEDASVLPRVQVELAEDDEGIVEIRVSDNGTGIPSANVADAFGRVLYGSKYDMRQKRGTFGLGVTMAVLYGEVTTDSPVEVHTATEPGTGHLYRIHLDIEHNCPVVTAEEPLARAEVGTTVSLRIKGDLDRSYDRVIDYLQLSTVCTPHARIDLAKNAASHQTFGPWTDSCPEQPVVSKPHPRSADPELLRKLLAGSNAELTLRKFLTESFQQVSVRTATHFIEFMALDPGIRMRDISRDGILRLSRALRKFDGFARPDSRVLSTIGTVPFLNSVQGLFTPDFVAYSKTAPGEWEGNPFIIEGVVATSPSFVASDGPSLQRFANRVPLLYDASEDVLFKAMRRLNWTRYGVADRCAARLFVHLCSTRIPYKAAGKQSIAAVAEIEDNAMVLFRDLGRKLMRGLASGQGQLRNNRKAREFAESLHLIAKFGAELAERPVPKTDGLIKSLFEVDYDE